MYEHAMVWTTDSNLQVTSLTARLRGYAGVGDVQTLHVSDLWGSNDPFSIVVLAHQWALDGERMSFEAVVRNTIFAFELEPLHDLRGSTIGVAGRAVEIEQHRAIDSEALRHAERSTGIGTWHEDLRMGLVTISEGLANLLGIDKHAKRFDIRSFDHVEERDRIAQAIVRQDRDAYVCDHRVHCANGRVRTVRERVRLLYDERGVAIARIGTLADISDFKEREAELSELALRDSLTNLLNRPAIEEQLTQSLARCERNERRCAAMFIDLDDFKTVNDTHGHAFGDRVLAAVAARLERQVRSSDAVARIGGDEFVVVVDDLFSADAALDAARKLLRCLDEAFTIEGHTISVTASIGIATSTGFATTAQDLLKAADREMYLVKRNGGRGVKMESNKKETVALDAEKGEWPARYSTAPRHCAIPANASPLS